MFSLKLLSTSFLILLSLIFTGVGMLLFIAHAIMSPEEVKCRFYGPCAVMCVSLNTIEQHPLTDDGNFVMSFTPLNNGKNELEISTVKSPKSKVCNTRIVILAN